MEMTGMALLAQEREKHAAEARSRAIAESSCAAAFDEIQKQINALLEGDPSWSDIERTMRWLGLRAAYKAVEATQNALINDFKNVQQFRDANLKAHFSTAFNPFVMLDDTPVTPPASHKPPKS